LPNQKSNGDYQMTIKATELLKLLTKVEKLELSVNVREDKDGDYVIKIFKMFESNREFEPYKVVITQEGESDWNKGNFYYFDCMMDILDEMLEKQNQREIKEQKRQELIAKLTPEERELLNLN
jgi:hypothetical protein